MFSSQDLYCCRGKESAASHASSMSRASPRSPISFSQRVNCQICQFIWSDIGIVTIFEDSHS